jgi:FKBP-type peptidyl-prolyl cis-trans isomerase (trigger factor)
MTSSTEADLEGSLRDRSAREVRVKLVLDQIVKEESIEVTDEEFDGALAVRAEKNGKPVDEYRDQLSEDMAGYIKSGILNDKLMSFLTSSAKRV